MSMSDSKPHNGQQEPRYTDDFTVACSIWYPHLTCHEPTERCAIQAPHAVVDCGEWQWPEAVVLVKSAVPLTPW